jgi:ATP-dependent Lon protease
MIDEDVNQPLDMNDLDSTAEISEPDTVSQTMPSEPRPSDTPKPTQSETTLKLLPANQMVLPVVPIREGVLFPSTESVLTFGRPMSIVSIHESMKSQNLIVLLTQKKANQEDPGPADLYEVGTLAMVERTLKTDDQINALVRGIGRVKVIRYIKTIVQIKLRLVNEQTFCCCKRVKLVI